MGKTSLCIRMLELLNTGRMYKASELAAILETNERNIIEYRKELVDCGYYIITTPGKNGGYRLDKSIVIPSLRLTNYEKNIIYDGISYLNCRNDFPNKEKFTEYMGRILSASEFEFKEDHLIINRFPLIMDEERIRFLFNELQTAINYKNVVELKYESQKKSERTYLYHPYELFMYNNAWFVIGWNEKFNNISYFKLNRINDITITDKKFKQLKTYKRSDYIDNYGFVNNGDWYHIEFVAKNVYAQLCKERIYGKNQIIEIIDENNTLVKVDMKNEDDILHYILGMGKNVDVLYPTWLNDKLVDYAKFILEKHENREKNKRAIGK